MTQTELVQKAERGERITDADTQFSMFNAPTGDRCAVHDWRTLVCDGDRDVAECRKCGVQDIFKCDFDDEYS